MNRNNNVGQSGSQKLCQFINSIPISDDITEYTINMKL